MNFFQKTNLISLIADEKKFRYINLVKNINFLKINNLYGDIKILVVKSIKDADKLISILKDNISTIALDQSNQEITSMIEFNMPPRICDIGSMSSLGFWEAFDDQSDFDIYNLN